MGYMRLGNANIVEYVRSVPVLRSLFSDEEILDVEEIGDGNLNFVFLVRGKENALIVKQAVPFLRCVGEEFPLAVERMKYESRSLIHFGGLAGEQVPKIFHSCETMSLVAMEYLGEHKILRKELIAGKWFPRFVEHITTFLAETLFKTSSLYLTSHEKRDLMKRFNDNKDLCKLTEDFIFTLPFTDEEHPLITDSVKVAVIDLKYKFMTQANALTHGDLHTGSIMVSESETKVIDSEFAFFGPMGFDIGLLFANVMMNGARHRALGNETFADEMDALPEKIWVSFEQKFLALWNQSKGSGLGFERYFSKEAKVIHKDYFMSQVYTDACGYAGCEIIRRLLGIAKVEDIETIEDPELKEKTVDDLIFLATELLITGDLPTEAIV